MSKGMKILFITASALVFVGLIIFGGAMACMGWNFSELSTATYVTNEYNFSEKIESIIIDSTVTDVIFVTADKTEASVVCYEMENASHTVELKDGTLSLRINDQRKWYEHIGINFKTPRITVTIPKGEYASLNVKLSTGDLDLPESLSFGEICAEVTTGRVKSSSDGGRMDIRASTGAIFLKDVTAEDISLATSTGRIRAENINCKNDFSVEVTTGDSELVKVRTNNFSTTGSTGDLELSDLIAVGKLYAERSTGDIELDGCDGGEICIKLSTGDLEGTLLTEKSFSIQAGTGDVEVPRGTSGGRCEITTKTGDIEIEIAH